MKGFTLIEIIVVAAIFTGLVALGLFMSMETFRGTLHRSEREVVVSLLAKARSRALANISQTAWGVCALPPSYVIFREGECTAGLPTNEAVPASETSLATFSNPIVFSALTATTSGGTVTVVQDGRTSTITVNSEGTINW